MINVRTIKTHQELLEIKDSWNLLIKENPALDKPFYRWEWFEKSWKYYKENSELNVIVVEENNKIVGILPLVKTKKVKFCMKYNELVFCNTINTPRNTLYVLNKELECCVLKAIIAHLLEKENKWDLIKLDNVPDDTNIHEELLKSEIVFSLIQTKGRCSPRIEMNNYESVESYFSKNVSKKTRKRYKVNLNRLYNSDMKWIIRTYSSRSEIEESLSAVFEVRKNSWKGDYDTSRYPKFITEISRDLCEYGEVLVVVLEIDGYPVAAEYILRSGSKFYALTNDYDGKFSEYAPGACLLYLILKRGFEEKWSLFDTTGNEHDYKKSISNHMTLHSNFQIFNKNIKAKSIFFAKAFIFPFIRYMIKSDKSKDIKLIR